MKEYSKNKDLPKERFSQMTSLLRQRMQQEEAQHRHNRKLPTSLWTHSKRVASLAQKIGAKEGVDPLACYLAGLFHDSGKFKQGRYHADDIPEEEQSVEVFCELAAKMDLPKKLITQVSQAILELYTENQNPAFLTRVLFDADNLDKLGFLGAANYFVKAGLKGKGVSPSLLYGITVELTYARYAPEVLATETGRDLAQQRAPETRSFFLDFLDSLRQDGLYDFRVNEIDYKGLTIDAVAPVTCQCGHTLERKIWEVKGVKCREIHLEYVCENCSKRHNMKFCRPRLLCGGEWF